MRVRDKPLKPIPDDCTQFGRTAFIPNRSVKYLAGGYSYQTPVPPGSDGTGVVFGVFLGHDSERTASATRTDNRPLSANACYSG
jgi:hypothetical protein